MVETENKLKVVLTTTQYFSNLKLEKVSSYYMGEDNSWAQQQVVNILDVNKIPAAILNSINNFIVNLDNFFKDELLNLANTFTANRYLSSLQDDFLKAWLVMELLRHKDDICLIFDTNEDLMCWKQLLIANNILVDLHFENAWRPLKARRLIGAVKHIAIEYLALNFNFAEKIALGKLNFVHWVTDKNNSHDQIISESRYYKQFINQINSNQTIGLLGHVPSGHPDFKAIVQSDINFIQGYITFIDVISALLNSTKLLFKPSQKILFEAYDFSALVSKSLQDNFWNGTYIRSLLIYKAFRRIADELAQNATIIYPFENQPWERSLLLAVKKQTKNIKLMAYQFFPIPSNFLIYKFSAKVLANKQIPDKILTSDVFSNIAIQNQGLQTLELGSVRYSGLLSKPLAQSNNKKILCCLFLDRNEAISMTMKIVELSKMLEAEFIINYHPQLAKDAVMQLKAMIARQHNIHLTDKPVDTLLNDILLLIYNSSSVCFEAALRGIPVMYLECAGLINLDRFNGQGIQANGVGEAFDYIQRLIINKSDYDDYSRKAYSAANKMILPFRNDVMEQIISGT
jgi:hypothetical protein